MRATIEYLGRSADPNRPTSGGDPLAPSDDLRVRLADAAIAAADQWNEDTNNTLLGDSNIIEHYRLVLDFAVRKLQHPIEVV